MRIWLLLVAALVFCMIVVGGAVRLTDSGLSITEWQPLLGAIPPLNDADWLTAFEKYKAIPEYAIVNAGMSLEAFKAIYWWEWAHRFLGRFIGIAFALPFLAFWLTGVLRGRFALKCLGVLALGGLQGAIGWYMVKSGLSRPHRRQPVPPGAAPTYRLCASLAPRVAGAGSRSGNQSACACAP